MFKELMRMAKDSNEQNVLEELADHQSSDVRRMVAKNLHTPKEILHKLVEDPVLNVAYLAVHNPNNSEVTKDFGEDFDHPCVICTNDDMRTNCKFCLPLQEYRAIERKS